MCEITKVAKKARDESDLLVSSLCFFQIQLVPLYVPENNKHYVEMETFMYLYKPWVKARFDSDPIKYGPEVGAAQLESSSVHP
jgi:hypothetical protein